uniref:Uncharacterized protein n=1 Tax=Amphimedon queenslandica TaxID=400682 RepID=A0A1X7TXP3_AMPQE
MIQKKVPLLPEILVDLLKSAVTSNHIVLSGTRSLNLVDGFPDHAQGIKWHFVNCNCNFEAKL